MGSQPEESLRIVGLSHRTAPVALRERLAFRAESLPHALGALIAHGCREAAILSTCNRVEVIALGKQAAETGAKIRAFLSEYHSVPEAEVGKALYEFGGLEAACHLFEVAASLDSQILGETEILAQAKEAYRVAAQCGACGPVLRAVFERAFFLSKQVRTDGGIGRMQASVSSAAVALAGKLFELKGRKLLVIGTGEMARGIVRSLKAAGVAEFLVASRTEERAREFAKEEGGTPCQMQHLEEHLTKADLVLVSSAAPQFVVRPAHVLAAALKRRGRVLCFIDIAVPRNVDPAVAALPDTFLYDIDDLEEVARDGRKEREAVAARWRPKLAVEARQLFSELADRHGTQTSARKLIEHADAIREEVLKQARTSGMDARALEELAHALERMQGRFLRGPLQTLKEAARDGDGADATAWLSRLFRLEAPVLSDSPDATESAPKCGSSDAQPGTADGKRVASGKEEAKGA